MSANDAQSKRILRGERGGSLVSELIALALMGIAFVVFMGGLSTTSAGVNLLEQRVSAENYARQQLELVKAAPYQPNPTVVPYPTVALRCPEAVPACTPVYTIQLDVAYWDDDAQAFGAQVAPGASLQRVRVRVYSQQRGATPIFALEGLKAEAQP